MSFQLHITSTAEHDIMRAVDYIEFVLKNPQVADNLLDAVTKQIGTLSDFPQKFRIVDDLVLTSWEIRFVIINNYLAFYIINEEKQTVIVAVFSTRKATGVPFFNRDFPWIKESVFTDSFTFFEPLFTEVTRFLGTGFF